jgi:DNA-binding response OmpR family regulator
MTAAPQPKLLIVDDAPDMRHLLAKYFQQASFQTSTAATGSRPWSAFGRTLQTLFCLTWGCPISTGLRSAARSGRPQRSRS